MFELLHNWSDWTIALADSDYAIILLLLVSFSESIFFPIPPDPLLIVVGIANPSYAIWIAGLVTIASVFGASLGYWLGKKFGRPILNKFISPSKIQKTEDMFHKYGIYAILVAAITPIPYKVFAILAGIMNLDIKQFVIISLIGRGIRMLTIGILIYIFGESIQEFIDNNFELLSISIGCLLILILALYVVIYKKNVFAIFAK